MLWLSCADQPQPMPEDPTPVLESVPEQLVRQLPQLLGQRGCTELAYSKCTAAMMHLVHCAKRHKAIMLAELEADLLRCGFYHFSGESWTVRQVAPNVGQ